MMDFTAYLNQKIPKFYGGGNGNKKAINMNGEVYMLKFPAQDKRNFIDYTNSCISEYISCQVFALLGMKTQETILGKVNHHKKEKIVVACKDFTAIGVRLQEFAEIKNGCLDSSNNGYGTNLYDVLDAINEQEIISPKVVKDFFWDMFIIDALLGNFDRHNGNWGFLINDFTNEVMVAPVYDCGSCLYPMLNDDQIEKVLENPEEVLNRIYVFPNSALKIDNQKINYYEFINSLINDDCNAALLRIYKRINLNEIDDIIEHTPYISSIRKHFYKHIIRKRYALILTPAYEKYIGVK